MALHICLVEPEIPANTGNIARTCAATNTHLHLVRPLGFRTDDATLKRAGLDYWHSVHVHYYDHFDEVKAAYPKARFYCASTKNSKHYHEYEYQDEDFFVFGKETQGLPLSIIESHRDTGIRLPMTNNVRSLNLSNSVAIVIYEALKQLNFPSMN